jgi:hypothetical protein
MSAADNIKAKLLEFITSSQTRVIQTGNTPPPSGESEKRLRASLLDFFNATIPPPTGMVTPFASFFDADVATSVVYSIVQTNKTDGSFLFAATGQNGKLYFCGSLWYLDGDGDIKQTNITTGSFSCAALGQNGKLYFGSNDGTGIWFLDNDDEVKQTNITTGSFSCAALGQNNKLYFGSAVGDGVWYLDDDNELKQTNRFIGSFLCAALGQNGKLYFGSAADGGVWFLDDDNELKRTNKTTGGFYCAARGQDGKLYFGSSNDEGIWYLDDDDDEVKQTNITTGSFLCAALGQNNKLYFGSFDDEGLLYLDDDDGDIKQTNKTTGAFYFAALGQNGKLYFGSIVGDGLWYLDDDGEVKQSEITTGSFTGAATGQDGNTYFYGDTGVWRLEATTVETPVAPPVSIFKYGSGADDDLAGKDANDISTDLFVKSCQPVKGYILLIFSVEDIFRKCMRYTLMKSKVLDFQTKNQGEHLANLIALTEDEWEFFGEDFLHNAAIAVHNIIGAYGRTVGVRSMVFDLGTVSSPGTIIYALKVPEGGFFHNYVLQLYENMASALYYSVLQQWAQWCNDAGEVQANSAKYAVRSEAIMSFRNIGCPRTVRPTRYF